MSKKLLLLGIALFLSISLLSSSTQTAQALGTPVKISNSVNDTVFPQSIADTNGYLHMTWMETTPGQAWTGANPGILYSKWNGDTWSTPLKISENTGFAEIPSIASDSTNRVHVVWDDTTYGDTSDFQGVAYKTRTSAGVWSAIETLPRPAGTLNAWNARIAIDGSGNPNVVFDSNTGGQSDSIYWITKVSGNWTTPVLVSKDTTDVNITDSQWSDLKSDVSGNLHLTYWSWSKGVLYRKFSSGAWSTPVQISSSSDIQYTRTAVTPAGEVFVSWYEGNDQTVKVRWTQSAVWQNVTTLTSLGAFSFWGFPIMGVTTDSKERAHIGWGERNVGTGKIDLKYRSFVTGVWAAAQDVNLNNDDADSPSVFPDKWDNQHFSWSQYNATSGIWEIFYRVAEGTVQSVTTGGGTVTANPGNVTYADITIPNTALTATTQIAIQIGPVPESVSGAQVTIPRSTTFRPHGLVFANGQTATSRVFYTDAEVLGLDEATLKPWYWNSSTNLWEAKTGTIQAAQNRISVTLTGFSLYGISGKKVNTEFTNLTANQSLNRKTSLQIKFNLTYTDASPFRSITDAEDLVLVMKNSSGGTTQTYRYSTNPASTQDNGTISLDTNPGNFKAVVDLKKTGEKSGNFRFEVLLSGNKVGEIPFTIIK